jgi:pseudaminic acid synthase
LSRTSDAITIFHAGKSNTGMVILFLNEIKAGEPFTDENVRSIRPGYGLHPKYLREILGKKAKTDIKRGAPLSWDDIAL